MKKGIMFLLMIFLFLEIVSYNMVSASSYYDSYSSGLFWYPLIIIVIIVVVYVIYILIAYWVYKDAKKRGENGILWALIVFFAGLLGILIWIAMRPPIGGRKTEPDRRCPSCGRGIPFASKICPYCARRFETYL